MHKNKDGNVTASLTEVKNKTGDIFALVDQFGEVVLTSYNKPRYRIVKMNVGDMLDLEEKKVVQPKPSKSVISRVKQTVSTIAVKQQTVKEIVPVVEEQEASLINPEVIKQLSKMKTWDRDGKAERLFVKKALIPLQ